MVERWRLNIGVELKPIRCSQSAEGDIPPDRVAVLKVKAEEVIIELMTLAWVIDRLVLEF